MTKKILSALVCAAAVLSLAGCGSENPFVSDALNTLTSNANNTSVVNNSADVIPEIPVTDAKAFKYEYNADMGGMVITDYLKESPKSGYPINWKTSLLWELILANVKSRSHTLFCRTVLRECVCRIKGYADKKQRARQGVRKRYINRDTRYRNGNIR